MAKNLPINTSGFTFSSFNKVRKIKIVPNEKEEEKIIFSDFFNCKFPDCKGTKGSITLKQIRGLDEAPTEFYTCYECVRTFKNDN
jgi:DNA-directed RNA polymerase subunit M/transcription elongation factor TFIIS